MKKRTLLIGLGGTGGQVLLAWRRALAANGMPPAGDDIACLYLDAADDVAGTAAWCEYAADIPFLNLREEARSLNEMEQNPELRDCVGGMRWQLAERLQVPVYEVEKALAELPGAGGLRRYGRALLLQSWPAVLRLLKPLVEGDLQLEVHVFFSATGGTGAGAAMDMLSYLEKVCLRKPGSVLLPYAFFAGTATHEHRLAAELTEWLDWADEDLVPHCYLSTPVADLPAQVQSLARALACGRQFFYIGGEYYDHLYDPIHPRGSAPGDRFASLGFATGPAGTTGWLATLAAPLELQGGGRGPRRTLLVALPRTTPDPRGAEMALEDALDDGLLPFRVNDSACCCMAPGDAAQAVLLTSGISPASVALFARLPESGDYFTARNDQ